MKKLEIKKQDPPVINQYEAKIVISSEISWEGKNKIEPIK